MTYWCNCDTCDYCWCGVCVNKVPCEKALIMPQHKELAEQAINNVLPADVEPVRHGRWIDAEIQLESGGSMPIQVCSLCKTFYPLAYTGGGHRFCPNCGARMDGEQVV